MIEYPIFLLAACFLWMGLARYSRAAAVKHRIQNPIPGKVLILTAAVGGGHEAAGRALRTELEQAGHSVEAADGLKAMSRGLDWLLVRFYCNQVRSKPRSVGAVFVITSTKAGAWTIRVFVGLLFAKRLLGLIQRERPEVVISTYPLVTAALERLRVKGGLRAPAVAVIPDYGVHPLWVAPSLDLHLVVSRQSVELTEHAGGVASLLRIPVDPAFHSAPPRDEARARLEIPQKSFVVLVVGGAWGIGDLEGAARHAAKTGAYTIVVTGENSVLKQRLQREFAREENVRILGWSKDLPALMSAADCLIQNAGGMTCIEAIEMGLPMLMFEPILGHGELNCLVMEQAGTATLVRGAEDLSSLLSSAVRREISLSVPEKTGAPGIVEALESLSGDALVRHAPRPMPRRRIVLARPALVCAVALGFFAWSAFASSGMALAAKAFRFDVPGYDPAPGKISLAVRVEDPATAAAVENFATREKVPVTIFATTRGAGGLYPQTGLDLGVAEEAGDGKFHSPLKDRAEDRNAAVAVRRAAGVSPKYFLPSPKTDLASLAEAPPHTRLVMAERDYSDGPRSGLLVVDSSGLGPEASQARLVRTLREIHDKGLQCVPPDRL